MNNPADNPQQQAERLAERIAQQVMVQEQQFLQPSQSVDVLGLSQ